MEPKTKFKLRTYFYYLLVEPWTEKVTLPNLRTVVWIIIIVSAFLRITLLLLASVVVGAIIHLIQEYKSGKHIYWYRQRKFKEQREALKKVREEKKEKNEKGQVF